MDKVLLNRLETQGIRARVVSIERLGDLQDAYESAYRQGAFDQDFYDERLAPFTFEPPIEMPAARSLIVASYADPPVRFTFALDGFRIPVGVPPTYLHGSARDARARLIFADLLAPFRIVDVVVPKKLLAVCSGLAAYGRNNLTYVEGWGSYHRLAAFCSDLPCDEDEWREPTMAARCDRCTACLRRCPTEAVGKDRFLAHAERCLTFWNEKPGHQPFPDWIDPSWHNSLVGCMLCQHVCPENRDVWSWLDEGAEFSEAETQQLLEGAPLDTMPATLLEKLERWDLIELLDVIPRNLKVLLDQANIASRRR